MNRLALVTAFVAIFVSNEGFASFMTGNDLLKKCTSERAIDKAFCLAYLMGMADELVLMRSVQGKSACVPPGVTAAQLMDVVLASLKASPEIRHADASFLVSASFGKAWECQ